MQGQITRIQKMEAYFDDVQKALVDSPECVHQDSKVQEMLRELTQYYESGRWLEDYSCDEQGLLPSGLKRGVLSQDGLYDLLCRMNHLTDCCAVL